MKQKKALIKLAQVRLAINHVLRQRMVKNAAERYSTPNTQLDLVPSYIREYYEEHLLPDEGIYRPGQPYRPMGWQGDINTNNPAYQGAMLRDFVGPLWNQGLDWWQKQRLKPEMNWYKRQNKYIQNAIGADRFSDDPDINQWQMNRAMEAGNEFMAAHPKPPAPTEMPRELYMNTPYKINGKTYTYPTTPKLTR